MVTWERELLEEAVVEGLDDLRLRGEEIGTYQRIRERFNGQIRLLCEWLVEYCRMEMKAIKEEIEDARRGLKEIGRV